MIYEFKNFAVRAYYMGFFFFAVMLINDICCRGFFLMKLFLGFAISVMLFTEITWKFSLRFWSSFKYQVFAVLKSMLEF